MKWIGISVLAGVVVAVLFSTYGQDMQNVHMYDDHFDPEDITVKRGTTIQFISHASREVWPASDSHPSHGIYPEFDPQRPILPGETWEFVFDRVGVWEFHDHLLSTIKGSVTVKGAFGETARGCVDTRSGTARAACWETDFSTILEAEGLDSAFNVFVGLYETEPAFSSYCHDIMHYFGRAAYDIYTTETLDLARQETSYCGYGFHHGFIEASYETEGPSAIVQARDYCESLRKNPGFQSDHVADIARNACRHGIGHAVLDSLPGEYWGNPKKMVEESLLVCESLYDKTYPEERCATGVFNSLATALNNGYYNLVYADSDDDLIELCYELKDNYQGFCLLDVMVSYMRHNNMTLDEKIQHAQKITNSEHLKTIITATIDDEFRSNQQKEIQEYTDFCLELETDLLRRACVTGIIDGIQLSSHVNNVTDRYIVYCTSLQSKNNLYEYCRHTSAGRLAGLLPYEQYVQQCQNEPLFAPYCVEAEPNYLSDSTEVIRNR